MFPIPAFAYKLIGFAAALAVVAAGAWYQGHHSEALKFDTYKAKQTAIAAQQVASNATAVGAISASEVAAMHELTNQQSEQINELTKRRDALLAERGQLAQRLRVVLTRTSEQPAAVPQASASPSGHDGAGDTALPNGLEQLVEWNTRQFYEADVIAEHLTTAQAIIREDREVCNGSLPGVSP